MCLSVALSHIFKNVASIYNLPDQCKIASSTPVFTRKLNNVKQCLNNVTNYIYSKQHIVGFRLPNIHDVTHTVRCQKILKVVGKCQER